MPQPDRKGRVLHLRPVARRRASLVLSARDRPVGDEHLDNVVMPLHGGPMQGHAAAVVCSVGARQLSAIAPLSLLGQKSHHRVQMAVHRRLVEG